MKCQILFSGKNKKNISKCHLLKILPRVLSVNTSSSENTSHKIKTLCLSEPRRRKTGISGTHQADQDLTVRLQKQWILANIL